MDSIFKALADPSRRDLLDALRQVDGQTLSELEAALPLSRFGVAKHLTVLEEAGLLTRVKRGRFTHHYLNAVPLAEALGRWIEPYRVAPAVRAVLTLKARLEGSGPQTPDFALTTYIRCSQAALWSALTDAGAMSHWQFKTGHPRSSDVQRHPMVTCDTLEQVPTSRLITSFQPLWDGGGPPSRVVHCITREGGHCRLTTEHFGLRDPPAPGEGLADGWERWAAGLKTMLETGEAVRFTQRPPD